jgi:hypothetical protein
MAGGSARPAESGALMSRFFRRARTLLSSLDDFPRVDVAITVFPHSDSSFLLGLPKGLSPEDYAKLGAEAIDWESPANAGVLHQYRLAEQSKFTGTIRYWARIADGELLFQSGFWVICHGDKDNLFEAIADYAGHGLAELATFTAKHELELIKESNYSMLWCAAILNFTTFSGWKNQSVETLDDPRGRFQMLTCKDALQVTWDALSELMLLDRARGMPQAQAEGPWSQPDTPAGWAKRFNMSWDALKLRLEDGTIRNKKLSPRSYQIHIDDVPYPKPA